MATIVRGLSETLAEVPGGKRASHMLSVLARLLDLLVGRVDGVHPDTGSGRQHLHLRHLLQPPQDEPGQLGVVLGHVRRQRW